VNQTLIDLGVILLAYLLGSVPFGLLIVKISTGKDIARSPAGGRAARMPCARPGFGLACLPPFSTF